MWGKGKQWSWKVPTAHFWVNSEPVPAHVRLGGQGVWWVHLSHSLGVGSREHPPPFHWEAFSDPMWDPRPLLATASSPCAALPQLFGHRTSSSLEEG